MRPILPAVLLAGGTLLLTACEKQLSSPLVDFVSNGTALTADRIVTSTDTFEVRAFAESRKDDPELARFTIETEEKGYFATPENAKADDKVRLYLDTTFTTSTKRFLFINRFGASASNGQQYWRYTAYDTDGNIARRSYRIIARPADSTAALHSYSVRLQAPRQRTNRAALAASRGFVVPPHATDQVDYQELVDLLYVPTTTGPRLASPRSALAATVGNYRLGRWTLKRNTQIGQTTLTAANFDAITTAQGVTDVVTAATLTANADISVVKGQVVAFRTADGNDALVLVRDLGTVAPVDLVLAVKFRRY